MSYIYVKDKDGFVVKKLASKLQADETIITKEEFEILSGDEYYSQVYGHGGKRKGAGRKPTNGVVLKFQIRVSEKEKEFINFARSRNLNYDELMQG
jgi:hypothetical protein